MKNGKVIEFYGMFHVLHPTPESYVGPIEVYYIGRATNITIETICPKWYNHVIEYPSVLSDNQAIFDVKYKCSPCSDNYYSTHVENNTLSFNRNDNITVVERLKVKQGMARCENCPYGALCTGNNVMPRPNYWGFWYEDELIFQQCPESYCCSNTESSTCDVYNYCPGNKTGILCGACQEGFSVSILTGACTSDVLCGRDQWFWRIVILAAISYGNVSFRK